MCWVCISDTPLDMNLLLLGWETQRAEGREESLKVRPFYFILLPFEIDENERYIALFPAHRMTKKFPPGRTQYFLPIHWPNLYVLCIGIVWAFQRFWTSLWFLLEMCLAKLLGSNTRLITNKNFLHFTTKPHNLVICRLFLKHPKNIQSSRHQTFFIPYIINNKNMKIF